ncbi:MAG: type II toxin-antitoxin system HicA family toxin [Oscillospiraceae bacterium]|nr:type II toxin-antitoxin system HicA family toxin [Oscillospiraceae bacterium]
MPSWKDLRNFCNNDDWELYKETDHYYYRKEDDDGNIRRVKVSRGTGEIYGHLWQDILKRQLKVSKEYFNKKK